MNLHTGWTVDNYGPIWIPAKGETVQLTLETLPLYERAIKVYENNDLRVKNGAIYINGEKAQTTVSSDYKTITAVYTFPKTFFFPNPLDIIKEFYNLMLAFFNPASYAF
jgi:hypothetical protein